GRTLTFAQPGAGRPATAANKSPIAMAHMHQRTDRASANAPDSSSGSHLAQDTSRQATRLEGPDSTPARPTYLSPRSPNQLRPTSSTQPSAVTPPKPSAPAPNNNGASTAPVIPQAPATHPVTRNPRVDPPVVVRRGSSVADNNVPQVSPSPSNV